MSDTPLVSVIMTAYNAGVFLRPAIDSLLAQTFKDFEIVVLENGSSDGTRGVLRSYDDPRLRIIERDTNIGRTPGLILAMENVRGAYIANLDADDISLPTRLEKQVAYLQSHPDCMLVGAWCDIIDGDGRITDRFAPPAGTVYSELPAYNPVAHSAAMFRRDVAVAVGGYPADFPFSQDAALWLNLAAHGDVAVIGEPLAQIRHHGGSLTFNPKSALTRTGDAMRYYGRAIRLPALPPESIARGRAARAVEMLRHARAQAACGRPLTAARFAICGFCQNPAAILGQAGGWICRRMSASKKHA